MRSSNHAAAWEENGKSGLDGYQIGTNHFADAPQQDPAVRPMAVSEVSLPTPMVSRTGRSITCQRSARPTLLSSIKQIEAASQRQSTWSRVVKTNPSGKCASDSVS